MVIKRDGQGTTLFSEGRDIPGGEHAMEFNKNTCRWRLLGDASDVRRSNERKVIIDALRDNFEPMTPTEIAVETGMKLNNAKQLLRKMVRDDEVLKPERGKYALPERISNG